MKLQAMMEFIDNLSLEERLYWQFPCDDRPAPLELIWEKKPDGGRWTLKTEKRPEGYTYDRAGMAAHLIAINADTNTLARSMGASIMTQALYADLMLEGAKRLFGEEALASGLGNARKFVSSLTQQLIGEPSADRPHLKLVGQGKKD